ncbi:hypothetical protein QAD02_014532 [Eretmocerus hayati]|uniref:Uncharacterized protein n=1 Tax=Eretmocerus hayati TaxID=131215 RepID=A0ACC2P5A3_9HYME|nr:hypothetical protein QAD02_014532 [Eretmocerus hayati]
MKSTRLLSSLIHVAQVCVSIMIEIDSEAWAKPTDKESTDVEYENDEGPDDGLNDDGDNDNESSPSEPVQLLTKPGHFKVKVGSTAYLPCEVNPESEDVQWVKGQQTLFFGDTRLAEDTRLVRFKNNTLAIHDVQEKDSSDEYACELLMVGERPRVVHSLEVDGPGGPDKHVRLLPDDFVEVDQGSSVTIGCVVMEPLQPKLITWNRDGFRLKNNWENSTSIFIEVHNATRHVAGDYQCMVDTRESKPVMKHLKFRVRHVPEIEYEKEFINGKNRDRSHYYTADDVETNISCVVHSHPPLKKLHWYKDGQYIKIDNERYFKSDPKRSHHVLTIKHVTKEDLGAYQCKASNELGTAEGPVIILTDTPDQPIFVAGKAVGDAIEMQWRVLSYRPIVEAELEIRKDDGNSPWQRVKTVKVTENSNKEHMVLGTIHGIEAGKHEARLRVRNDMEQEQSNDAPASNERKPAWGPYSEIKKFDGEYQDDGNAESVKDSAMKETLSLTTLLLLVATVAHSCL